MARLRVLSAGAALAAFVLAPSIVRASGSVVPGKYVGKDFTITKTDVWNVNESGKTIIVTNTFTIDGTLNAAGLGTMGASGATGPGMGGGVGSMDGTVPGGGGGFIGKGGAGNAISGGICAPVTGAAGGMAFVDPMGDISKILGSAGGGSGTDSGGRGGGHLVIMATTVELNGVIDARGVTYTHAGGYAGGGSGGIIEIHAYQVIGKGKILAGGGDGAKKTAAIVGGGGAGGLVILDLVKKTTIEPDVSGGMSPGCMGVGDGEAGQVVELTPEKGCIDSDGDGFYPIECNPTSKRPDCDDSDPEVHPGQAEACDLIDNDCNGKIDDVAPDACAPGRVCSDGVCATAQMEAGADDGGASPDHIDFEGGCDIRPVATASGFALAIGALSGLALMFRMRRRRR